VTSGRSEVFSSFAIPIQVIAMIYTDILLKMELNSHILIKIRFRCISSLFSLVLTLTFNNIQFGFMAGNLSFNFDRTIIYKIV